MKENLRNVLASKYKCTGHPYLYLLTTNPQIGVLIPRIWKVLSYKTSNYGTNSFTLQMDWLYEYLDAGLSGAFRKEYSI